MLLERYRKMTVKQKAAAIAGCLAVFALMAFLLGRGPAMRWLRARGDTPATPGASCVRDAMRVLNSGYLHIGLDRLQYCDPAARDTPDVRAMVDQITAEQRDFDRIMSGWRPPLESPFIADDPGLNPGLAPAKLRDIEDFLRQHPDGYHAQLLIYARSLQKFADGDYAGTLASLNAGQELAAVNGNAWHLHALAALRAGNYDEVERAARAYGMEYAGSRMAHELQLLLAHALERRGRDTEALNTAQKVANDDAAHPFTRGRAFDFISRMYLESFGSSYAAIELVNIAKLYPAADYDGNLMQVMEARANGGLKNVFSEDERMILGRYFLARGQNDSARRILSEGPGMANPARRLLLARALFAQGRYTDAEQQLRAALSDSADESVRADSCILLGKALRKKNKNKPEDAEARLNDCADHFPAIAGQAYEELADMFAAREDAENKFNHYLERLAETAPQRNEKLLYIHARKNFLRGNTQAARRAYAALVEHFPRGAFADDALFWLARMSYDIGGDGAEYLVRLRNEYPYSYGFFRAGDYLERVGREPGPDWRDATPPFPPHTDSESLRDGYALMAMGYDAAAEKAFNAALARGGSEGDAAAAGLARLFRKQGKIIPSVKAIELRVILSPDYYNFVMNHITYRELLFPTLYLDSVTQYAQQNGVSPALALAVIRQESRFDKDATSRSNAKGLMQIIPSTGAWIASERGISGFNVEQLYNVDRNVDFGTWYIRYVLDKFDGNRYLAVAAYNGGPGNVRRWLKLLDTADPDVFTEMIPANETRDYVTKVLHNEYVYKILLSSE